MVKFRKNTSNDRVRIFMFSREHAYTLEIEGGLGEWVTETPSLTYWVISRIKYDMDCRHLFSEVIHGKV